MLLHPFLASLRRFKSEERGIEFASLARLIFSEGLPGQPRELVLRLRESCLPPLFCFDLFYDDSGDGILLGLRKLPHLLKCLFQELDHSSSSISITCL